MFNFDETPLSESDFADGIQLSDSDFAKGTLNPRFNIKKFNIPLQSFEHYPYEDDGYIVVIYGPKELEHDPYRKTIHLVFSDKITTGRYYFNDSSEIIGMSYREIYDVGGPSLRYVKSGPGYVDIILDLEAGTFIANIVHMKLTQTGFESSPFTIDALLSATDLKVMPITSTDKQPRERAAEGLKVGDRL